MPVFSGRYGLYLIFIIISAVLFLHKFKLNKYSVLLLLIFWQGMFQTITGPFYNGFKVAVVAYIFLLFAERMFSISRRQVGVIIAFVLFSLVYWFSFYFFGRGALGYIFSQYLYKLSMPFLLFIGLRDIEYDSNLRDTLAAMLLHAVFAQVYLSVIKILILGFWHEAIVGSLASWGGGPAVVFPLVSLFFYWVVKQGELKSKDWLVLVSFFIISVASAKRAPVMLFPFFIGLLLLSNSRSWLKPGSILLGAVLAAIIFYLGVRINKTLNPDNRTWGRFDLEYVIDYSLYYSFGSTDTGLLFGDYYESQGRGGSLFLMGSPSKIGLRNTMEILIGKSYDVSKLRSSKHGDWGFEHEGLVGSVVQSLYQMGYLGTVFMILFCLGMIWTMKDKRLRSVILLFYTWDLLLYANLVFYDRPTAFLMIFTIHYANSYNNRQLLSQPITLHDQKQVGHEIMVAL